ncbi:AdoMet_MTases domain containing protein [Candidatus Nanopelagicaceae bacterium]
MSSSRRVTLEVGQKIEVTIEKIAHGGHFIARHEGAVIFVRHGIPGELVEIVITSVGSSFNRADVLSVKTPSADRVSPPCRYANREGCGGCDFQHITVPRQRSLKSEVIAEQFSRIAKIDLQVEVEEINKPLGWRTRCTSVTTKNGSLGFYQARSHKVVAVDDCRILVPEMQFAQLAERGAKGDQRLEISISNTGERSIATANARDESPMRLTDGVDIAHYTVGENSFEVSQKSFWQSHKDAPTTLTKAVVDYAGTREGDQVLDLYGGVGLFTAALLPLVGETGSVDLVEGSKFATSDASRNFADAKNVNIVTGDVAKVITRFPRADVVVLDPPREGAGKDVVENLARIAPRTIVYVACDPAALARDTAYLRDSGYELDAIRAFDLFPMTHHIECIAKFIPSKVS